MLRGGIFLLCIVGLGGCENTHNLNGAATNDEPTGGGPSSGVESGGTGSTGPGDPTGPAPSAGPTGAGGDPATSTGQGGDVTSGQGGDPQTASSGQGGDPQTSSGGQGGSPPAPPPDLVPSITFGQYSLNCASAPLLYGQFGAHYDNTKGSAQASATVVATTLKALGAVQLAVSFSVSPTSSGPVAAGSAVDTSHYKMTGETANADPCAYCQSQWSLEVEWDVAGAKIIDSAPAFVGCTF
jgi:hypothetical protein